MVYWINIDYKEDLNRLHKADCRHVKRLHLKRKESKNFRLREGGSDSRRSTWPEPTTRETITPSDGNRVKYAIH